MLPHVDHPDERIGRVIDGKLLLTDILGVGAYGIVYSALDNENGNNYAVKCINKHTADGTRLNIQQISRRMREVRLHSKASTHPNIISLLRVINEHDGIYMVMEHCCEGDLFGNICNTGHYAGNDKLCKAVFLQILDAVEHCHNLGIYHRDLKPENFLVADQGWAVKLTDFGLATTEETSNNFGCGSERYISPECLSDFPETASTYLCAPNDVWALGVILINLVCARYPWVKASDHDASYRAFSSAQLRLHEYLPLTKELSDILEQVFQVNPELRMKISELRNRILTCDKFTQPAKEKEPLVTSCPNQVTSTSIPSVFGYSGDQSTDGSLDIELT